MLYIGVVPKKGHYRFYCNTFQRRNTLNLFFFLYLYEHQPKSCSSEAGIKADNPHFTENAHCMLSIAIFLVLYSAWHPIAQCKQNYNLIKQAAPTVMTAT